MKKLELEIIKKAMEHCKQTIFHADQGYPLGYVAVDILQEEVRLAFTAGIEAALACKPRKYARVNASWNEAIDKFVSNIKSLLKE